MFTLASFLSFEIEKNSSSKEVKRGTIESFFSSQTTKKKKKWDASLISSELIVSQTVQINTP